MELVLYCNNASFLSLLDDEQRGNKISPSPLIGTILLPLYFHWLPSAQVYISDCLYIKCKYISDCIYIKCYQLKCIYTSLYIYILDISDISDQTVALKIIPSHIVCEVIRTDMCEDWGLSKEDVVDAKELIWSYLISSNACLYQEAEEKMEGDKSWHWNWNWVFSTKREKLDLREADVQIITFNNLPSFTSQSI